MIPLLILHFELCVEVSLLHSLLSTVCIAAGSIVYQVALLPSYNSKTITNGHLLFVIGALIFQRVQKCEVRQVTKDVVKSEV